MFKPRTINAVFLLPCSLAVSLACYANPLEGNQLKPVEVASTVQANNTQVSNEQATVKNTFVTFSAYQVDEALLNIITNMSTYCREVELGKDELQCGPYSDAEWKTVEPLIAELTDHQYQARKGLDSASLPNLALDEVKLNEANPYIAPMTSELVTIAQQQSEQGNIRAYQEQVPSRLVAAGVSETEDWLSEAFGGAQFDLGVSLAKGSKWQVDQVESLFPFWQADDKSLWFIQAGAVFNQDDFHGRDFSHIGTGYRQLAEDEYYGVNTFIDYDRQRYHRRMSLGVEYGVGYGNMSSNFYFPLSNWKDSPDEYEGMSSLVEKPAKGWDLTLESYLPMDTRWKLSGTAGQYLGRYVEHRDGSNPTKNPLRFELNTEFKPTKELAFSLGYQNEEGASEQWIAGVNYTLSLGGFYEPERREVFQSSLPKQDRLTDFVERDHNIVLEYKQKYAEISIRLPESVVVAENSQQSLAEWMEVKGGPDIVSYTWLGTANSYLDSQSASVPLFTAPSYSYDGNNTLSLKVRYKLKSGQVKESNTMSITVTDSKFLESISFEPETATAGESIVASALLSKAVADIPVTYQITAEDLTSLTLDGETLELEPNQANFVYQTVTNEEGIAELVLLSHVAQSVTVTAIYDQNEQDAKQGNIEWLKGSVYRVDLFHEGHHLDEDLFTTEAITAYVFEDEAAVLDLSQYSFQWFRREHDTQNEFTKVANANQQKYVLKGEDQGFQFKVQVTKKKTSDSKSATNNK
ncbi:inverse autotransporter beta domain-containing protein [Vibrio sp. T3Y01]|uniref:inverse autotransporter beta domain-containing protein n=1 Tax=Vibrio sp. T3Y01 TaxID=2607606 RepID=UPI001493CE53|nr:inverse autotransporter beta domain-containing protein [Vibrio sp. T3Y01]NOI98036.1 hypothetical protein [Vibrio sp. T3Y01]